MFEIPRADLPIVRTSQALLILDLQNDFISTESILSVDKPADLLDKIADLVPQFRRRGKIIWVRSEFHAHRPVNDGTADGEMIITENELPGRRQRIPLKYVAEYNKLLEEAGEAGEDDWGGVKNNQDDDDEAYENEAFLTPEFGKRARCVTPMSLGANYNQVVAGLIDLSKDTFSSKSHYSAFKNNVLLQQLRGQFITELFLCGALTNISIFATAMDAVRYGYAITLVEDCAGYRSKERHDEAIRQLVETTGCAIVSSSEIIEEINVKELAQNQALLARKAGRGDRDGLSLPEMLNNLKIRGSSPPANGIGGRTAGSASAGSNIRDVHVSRKNGKLASSVESVVSIPNAPVESPLDESNPAKKSDDTPNKRVPNKIKVRRRPKTTPSDKDQSSPLPKTSSTSDRTEKLPVSATAAAVTKSTEALEKTPITEGEDTMETTAKPAGETIRIKTETSTDSGALLEKLAIADAEKDVKIEGTNEKTNSIGLTKESVTRTDQQSSVEDDSIPICDGDSKIFHNLLPPNEACDIFERIRDEVRWQKMSHLGGEVPRLVAVQGEIDEDGSIPIYRHPADESPPLLAFTPSVLLIKSEVEKRAGHQVNHCLIQFYRNGTNYISEHSDKTLDIVPNSFIANVSLGAMRAMTFRTKKPRKTHPTQASMAEEATSRLSFRAVLPHNSMCRLDLRTNAKWLHGIRQDRRRAEEKCEAELAYNGGRISLTFRLIGTFLDKGQTRIWGQGAVARDKKDALFITNGETPEAVRMLRAFGAENHSSEFNWKESYGEGFNVLHLSDARNLFLSDDPVANIRVKLSLSQYDLPWTAGVLSPLFTWQGSPDKTASGVPGSFPVCMVDNDLSRAQVQGDIAILLYLDGSYGPTAARTSAAEGPSQVQKARQYIRLLEAESLLQIWRGQPFKVKPFRTALASWNGYASEDLFIAGPNISIADLAFWPVLREIVNEWGDGIESVSLRTYYERVGALEVFRKVLEGGQEKERGGEEKNIGVIEKD